MDHESLEGHASDKSKDGDEDTVIDKSEKNVKTNKKDVKSKHKTSNGKKTVPDKTDGAEKDKPDKKKRKKNDSRGDDVVEDEPEDEHDDATYKPDDDDDEYLDDAGNVEKGKGRGWSMEKDRLLIEMWKEHPFLYDMEHEHHKRQDKRVPVLKRFAAKLNTSCKLI